MMAEDFDVEAMLEDAYKQSEKPAGVKSSRDESSGHTKSKGDKRALRGKSRSPSPDKQREKTYDDKGKDKDRNRRRSRSRDSGSSKRKHDRDGDRDRDRHRRKSRSRSRDRGKDRDRDRDRDRRSRSRDRRRDRRSKSRSRSRERRRRERERERERSAERRRGNPEPVPEEPQKSPLPILSPEERDQRTIFCWQLARTIRARDLEEFFSVCGKVRDVRLIQDQKTKRPKGIAYVEFAEITSVPAALTLSGQKLLNVPIQISPSQAEKNRLAAAALAQLQASQSTGGTVASSGSASSGTVSSQPFPKGPLKLYFSNVHPAITDDMLREIFESFGEIGGIQIVKDATGKSQGFGFVEFLSGTAAQLATEQLNGFILAERPLKVSNVSPDPAAQAQAALQASISLDVDEVDRAGIDLGPTGRLELMRKLAEGTDMRLPRAALQALEASRSVTAVGSLAAPVSTANSLSAPLVATPCFVLSNLFNPAEETEPGWEDGVRDDVLSECIKVGGAVLHIHVDTRSAQGIVYAKCASVAAAQQAVTAMHGRFFAGRRIAAAYIPLAEYHKTFPESASAFSVLQPL